MITVKTRSAKEARQMTPDQKEQSNVKSLELFDITNGEHYEESLSEYLSIEGVNSPEQLLDWMRANIEYELEEDEYSDESDIPTKTARDVLKTKKGHCAEQSYLEKAVLDALGYETQLVFIKENSSQRDYGPEGSAHVFLIYKDERNNFCWFEHAMEHAKGIHKYQSLNTLLQDVADKWWRYDKHSDILEVRFLDNPITGINNWQLAQACYDYPVGYIFDISNNKMEDDMITVSTRSAKEDLRGWGDEEIENQNALSSIAEAIKQSFNAAGIPYSALDFDIFETGSTICIQGVENPQEVIEFLEEHFEFPIVDEGENYVVIDTIQEDEGKTHVNTNYLSNEDAKKLARIKEEIYYYLGREVSDEEALEVLDFAEAKPDTDLSEIVSDYFNQ